MPAKEEYVAKKTEEKEERKERHSADPKSSVKQAAKKDGAGGKFSVGKSEDQDGPAVLDKGDPNYDSEEESKAKPEAKKEEKKPDNEDKKPLTEEEEKKEEKKKKIAAKVAAARADAEHLANLPKFEDFPEKFGKHKHSCDECKCESIMGFRWGCTKLKDYDICTDCYKEMKPSEVYTRKNHTGQTRKVTTADFSIAKGAGFKPTDATGNALTEKSAKKVKPNDPCPCGSEKKYKKCCGSAAGATAGAA